MERSWFVCEAMFCCTCLLEPVFYGCSFFERFSVEFFTSMYVCDRRRKFWDEAKIYRFNDGLVDLDSLAVRRGLGKGLIYES